MKGIILAYIFVLNCTVFAAAQDVHANPGDFALASIGGKPATGQRADMTRSGLSRRNFKRDMTVMVFADGENIEFCTRSDLKEMEQSGSNRNMDVLVQIALTNEQSKNKEVRRFRVVKNQTEMYVPPVSPLAGADMRSGATLSDFIKWGKKNFPSKRYILVVWRHGASWKTVMARPGAMGSEVSGIYDALYKNDGVDILVWNSCRMQGIEVSYELRKLAPYIVASEANMPGTGFNYALLNSLAASLYKPSGALAYGIARSYQDFYMHNRSPLGNTISAIRTDKLQNLAARIKEWTELLSGEDLAKARAIAADEKIQQFAPDFADMMTYIAAVSAASGNGPLSAKALEINELNRYSVFYCDQLAPEKKPDYKISGFSIFVPSDIQDKDSDYERTSFARDTGWYNFLLKIKAGPEVLREDRSK